MDNGLMDKEEWSRLGYKDLVFKRAEVETIVPIRSRGR